MKKLFLTNFHLKIIAMLMMTLDHIGYFLMSLYSPGNPLYITGNVFRCIGRIALPLFCFMAFEGALKTKNVSKYILRLGIVGTLILLVQIIIDFGFNQRAYQGNIFIDLIFGVLVITCLENDNKWIKSLSIIPLALGVISFFCYAYEHSYSYRVLIWWYPYFLRPQYDFIGILLITLFYFNRKYILPIMFKNRSLDYEGTRNQPQTMMVENLVHILSIVVLFLVQYSIKFWAPGYAYWIEDIQVCAIFAFIPLLFFNYQRGYNAKWFQYSCYLYYPLHIALIFSIFQLI